MTYSDIIKKSVLEGFAYADISTTKIIVTLLIAYALACYIHLVYKFVTKNSFYYRNYAVSMTVMAVVTAGIVIAMQSSLVISLGMVGALSIVRFRTAIKDPMDLLFLFWSIGIGIICGAGLYELAIITSLAATAGIVLFEFLPAHKRAYMLVINSLDKESENGIFHILDEDAKGYIVKSRSVTGKGVDYIIEARVVGDSAAIVDKISVLEGIVSVSVLDNAVDMKS